MRESQHKLLLKAQQSLKASQDLRNLGDYGEINLITAEEAFNLNCGCLSSTCGLR